MDYLGLVNAYIKESGVTDTVASLTDPSDDVDRAMHWLNEFWKRFQTSRRWDFRFAETSISVVNGTTQYDRNALNLNEGDIIIDDSFYNSAGKILAETYTELRKRRRDANTVDTTKVSHVAIRPNDGTIANGQGPYLETYPDVDSTQVVEYDIWRGAQALLVLTDEPYGLPSDFHMLIVHGALATQGALDGGQEGANQYAHHGSEYKVILNNYLQTLTTIPKVENTLGV